MLSGLFKSKEEKIREQIEEHLKNGMAQLQDKFFNKAMMEFDKAMGLNRDEVYPRLVDELSDAARSGQLEAALAIGLNLLKSNNKDYELANKLGNYARELGNYNQATGLYKASLKVKKNYQMAFYNLAAAMAKVDIYDEAIRSALSIFDDIESYVYPDYLGDEKLIKHMTDNICERKARTIKEQVQILMIQKEEKEMNGQAVEATDIELEIKELKKAEKEALPEDFIKEFEYIIKQEPDNKSHIYNMALYALSHRMVKKALETFKSLSASEFEYLELLQAIGYAHLGKLEGSINIVNKLLGENEFNRYNNVNLGLMYKKAGKQFLSVKYLIKTASLLDKSGGIYSMKDLIKLAYQRYREGKLRAALVYFQIAASEVENPKIWEMIGAIYISQKKYDDAVLAYRSMQKIDPTAKGADDKLREIHDHYCGVASKLLEERKFKPSATFYEKALGVLRLPDTIKEAAVVYKQLKDTEREQELTEEWRLLIEAEKAKEQEVERQKIILSGKSFLKKKNYLKAITNFESAFRMKVDKNVFLQLSALYKALKKHGELQSLVDRWEKMLEHQEKLQRYEKDKEREKNR
ncbi:MAG: hypothetical protein COB67_12180 [SAR324 cluster bacterium]|uniref:Tetratricopeptide repeat protein n=1 Tax=SAR324 cluster bacterium TaxID=2024889 RepID=A0A2A4SS66_9DELT|nr:MAG: hypothetical protein COB67_12180 [SAR324 cluster bacterium]